MLGQILGLEANKRSITSPTSLSGNTVFEIPDVYMEDFKSGYAYGQKIRQGYDEINTKFLNGEKKKGWFAGHYNQNDVTRYQWSNARSVSYDFEAVDFDIKSFLRYMGFLCGFDQAMYEKFFYKIETAFIANELWKHQLNSENLHLLNLVDILVNNYKGSINSVEAMPNSQEEYNQMYNATDLAERFMNRSFFKVVEHAMKQLRFYNMRYTRSFVSKLVRKKLTVDESEQLFVKLIAGVYDIEGIGFDGVKPFCGTRHATPETFAINIFYVHEGQKIGLTDAEVDALASYIGHEFPEYSVDDNNRIVRLYFDFDKLSNKEKEMHAAMVNVKENVEA